MPIQHHKDTLRTVTCNSQGLVLTGSFDKTCAFYQCNQKGEYNFIKDTFYHDDFIYTVKSDVLDRGFFSGGKDKRIIYEVMNVLNDQNIAGLPVLIVIDINNQDQGVVESLRKEMNTQMSEEKLNMVKFHYVDFVNDINQLKIGFDWLCETMKPLK